MRRPGFEESAARGLTRASVTENVTSELRFVGEVKERSRLRKTENK